MKIKNEVDQLFGELPDGLCINPLTGQQFVKGIDPIAPQKRMARRAAQAREWFRRHGPPDLQPLPTNAYEISAMKHRPDRTLFAYFAQSVQTHHYEIERHLPFEEYAAAVLALPHAPTFLTEDEGLKRRFPPRPAKRGVFARGCLDWYPDEKSRAEITARKE
jgi:hypothetical protein